ncbi:MAG: hypothetical protein ACRCTE_02105 [Cellulosilyticaceae bacterium]
MKKFIVFAGVTLLSLALVGCGMGNKPKTEKITDATTISQMDQLVASKVKEYFGYDVDPNVERDYQALKSFIPAGEDSKEWIHQANIFQAISKADPEVGTLHGYGGILNTDNQTLKGLIINVYNERGDVKSFTDGQLTEIASRFLKDKGLAPSDATLTFAGYNTEANSDALKVVLIESDTQRFAVGVDTLLGDVVYFETVDIPTEK